MSSATAGWALDDSQSPSWPKGDPRLLLVHTADGARTWTDVTPAAARPMLATTFASEDLDPVDGEHAYLAVTASTQDLSDTVPNTTAVFATADGGRHWTETASLRAAGTVGHVSFAGAGHGWLQLDAGDDAAGQPLPWLFRTADGGRHWSVAATADLPGDAGPNDFCQALSMTFTSATTGWLNIGCRSGAVVAVSQDGGRTWAEQSLPVPAACHAPTGPCEINGPQFTGAAGFLTVAPETTTAAPSLLVSSDRGQTWRPLILPAEAGQYPQITFFGPADGVLVAAGPQEALGPVFYTTADGGTTWTPIHQGTHFTQEGTAIDFVAARTGFAWSQGSGSQSSGLSSLYVTTNTGRIWTRLVPVLST